MTHMDFPALKNGSNRTFSISKKENTISSVRQKEKSIPSFNRLFSEITEHGENEKKTAAPEISLMQQELMKLVLMTQYQMNSAFFSAFDESDQDNASNDVSMNWIDDMGTGYDMDLPLSKFQQFSNLSGAEASATERNGITAELNGIINQASKAYDVDADLIRAVIHTESNFDTTVTSAKGAMGLMQLMPETADDLGVKDAYDPAENIHAGTRYLKSLLDRYEGNIPLSLAAYNWGIGNVERPSSRIPQETQDYIYRVNQYYQKAKAQWG